MMIRALWACDKIAPKLTAFSLKTHENKVDLRAVVEKAHRPGILD
jgi:hypothetical protein